MVGKGINRRPRQKTNQDTTPRDLAPKNSDSQNDMPRKYRFLLAAQNAVEKRKQEGEQKRKEEELKIPKLPNESLAAYSRRVDDSVRHALNAAAQAVSKTRQKRKAYLSAKKASKKKAHKKDDSDDEESVGYRKEKALKDEVKFGQVVQQPPSISVVPKLRGPAAKAAATEKLRQLELAKDEDRTDEKKKMRETNETDNFEKVGRKRKLRDLPEYERQLVLSERENAIALYRAAKSKKVRVSERECGDDDEMDDE